MIEELQISPASTTLAQFLVPWFPRASSTTGPNNMLLPPEQRTSTSNSNQKKHTIFSTTEFAPEAWNLLYLRLGDSVFNFLIGSCSIFRLLPNFNFFQVSGLHVGNTKANYVASMRIPHSAHSKLVTNMNKLRNEAEKRQMDHEQRLEDWKKKRRRTEIWHAADHHNNMDMDTSLIGDAVDEISMMPQRKKSKLRPNIELSDEMTPIPSVSLEPKNMRTLGSTNSSRVGITTEKALHDTLDFSQLSRYKMFYKHAHHCFFGLPKDWKGIIFDNDEQGAKSMASWIFEIGESVLPPRVLQSLHLFRGIIKRAKSIKFRPILDKTCPISMKTGETSSSSQCLYPLPLESTPHHTLSTLNTQSRNHSSMNSSMHPEGDQNILSASEVSFRPSQAFRTNFSLFNSSEKQNTSSSDPKSKPTGHRNDSPFTQSDKYSSTSHASTYNQNDEFFDSSNEEHLLFEFLIEPEENIFDGLSVDELLQCFTHHHQVSSFAYQVVRKLIPSPFFGSLANWQLLEAKISNFVRLNRFDTISSKHLLEGFKLNDITWLYNNYSTKGPHTIEDKNKRTILFHRFLVWIFEQLILPLLSTTFYITETMPHRNRVFYYRREIWSRVFSLGFDSLKDRGILTPVSVDIAKHLLNQRELGACNLRFIPKKNGLRPIVNLKKKFANSQKPDLKSSINLLLKPVHAVLTHESTSNPKDILASSLMKIEDAHQRLSDFKESLLSILPKSLPSPSTSSQAILPRLYFVKVDVISAFDEILQEKMMEILEREVLTLDRYLATTISKIRIERNRWRVSTLKTFISSSDEANTTKKWDEILVDKTKHFSNSLLAKHDNMEYIDRRELLELLEDHIKRHLIMHDGQFFLQSKGIPQGSTLSSLLCSLYFANLETSHLAQFVGHNGNESDSSPKSQSDASILLRWIDDFLYITTDYNKALDFFNLMHGGFKDFGTRCNPEKSVVNFDLIFKGLTISNVSSQPIFQTTQLDEEEEASVLEPLDTLVWCGWVINTKSFEFRRSIPSRVIASQIITNHITDHPGSSISEKSHASIRNGAHLLLFDAHFNTRSTILENVFDLCAWTAIRLVAIENGSHFVVSSKPKGENKPPPLPNPKFIVDLIFSLIQHLSNILWKRANSAKRGKLRYESILSTGDISFVSLLAFHFILKKKSRFSKVADTIESIIHLKEDELKPEMMMEYHSAKTSRSKEFASAIY
jgi:hypothetical protein